MSQPQEINRPAKKETSASSGVPLEQRILEEQIRSRAYGLYLLRGGAEGHDVEDWLRAEEEISQKAA
jgi:hypothetical protein